MVAAYPSQYPIGIDVTIEPEIIGLSMDISHSLMDEPQAQMVLATFEAAIMRLSTNDLTPIGDLSLLSDSDAKRIAELNGAYPSTISKCVHTVFSEQVEQQPDAIAISASELSLSYAELDKYATRLAAHLQSLHVGPGAMVIQCFAKNAWAVVAQLAVLKSGGVCALVRPDYAIKRLDSIVESTGATTVLIDAQYAQIFETSSCKTLIVGATEMDELSTRELVATVSPYDTAFAVLSSGSTTMLSHASLATAAQAVATHYVDSNTRVLQHATYASGSSIEELWTTLQCGGTVCLISDEDRSSNSRLTEAINNYKATFATLPETVASTIQPAHVPSLRTIALRERTRREVVAKWTTAGCRVM